MYAYRYLAPLSFSPGNPQSPKPHQSSLPASSAKVSVSSFRLDRWEFHNPHQLKKLPETNDFLAIDFGTTHTYVSVIENNQPKFLLSIPSVAVITSTQPTPAEKADPRTAISSFKNLIGRKYRDPYIQNVMKAADYQIVEGTDGEARVETPYGVDGISECRF